MEREGAKYLFNRLDTAEILGVCTTNLENLPEPKYRAGRDTYYDIREVLAARDAARKEKQTALDEARTKLARAQTAKLRTEHKLKKLELEREAGRLVEVATIGPALARAAAIVRTSFLRIVEEEFNDVDARREAVYEILTGLSETNLAGGDNGRDRE